MKNRTITKITSCILCTAMSMHIGLALTEERINAAESITVEGIIGGVYYHGELTIIAPDGYELWCSHLPDDGYQESLTIGEDIVDNSDVYFTLRSKSDGTTQTVWLSELLPEYGLIVDNNPPYTFEEFIYFDEEPYQVTANVYDGAIIKSDRLYLEVEDDYALDSVVVTVNGTEKYNKQGQTGGVGLEIGDWVSNPNAIDIDLDAVNHITITAVDDAENEFSVSFVMLVDLVEFDPTVSVDDILIGGTPVPSFSNVPDDYDGEPEISYWDEEENEVDSFDSAGTYTIFVSFPSTDLYTETVCDSTFEVSKKTFTPEVTVADILIGGTPAPSISNVPDDYNGTRVIRYLNEEENETTTFDTAGEYTVEVSFPETDLYEATSCSSTFVVGKKTFEPEVSIDDFYVGSTPAPSYSNVPDDYDGELEIIYFTEDEEEVTEFNAAGSYFVTVIFPETDIYEETACNDYFEVNEKETFIPSITVDDINVGGTIELEPENIPEDYDGEITYEFKISTAADTTYTEEIPEAAGTYIVKATFSSTDKYEGTTCTDNFTISKIDITEAEVSVDNIKVGQTPAPSVTGLPEDYDGEITYSYIDENGETCSADSLKAGTYLVMASISDTDNYVGLTCETEFEVSKNDITDAEVTVDNIKVGQTPAPSVTGLPEDYDGEITFKYKSGVDGEYSATVPTAAGTYEVLATLAETDKYLGTSCTGTFTISKIAVEAEVSVDDIFAGGTVDPVVTVDPEGYDGEISYQYKRTEDANYTSSVPSAAGTYEVLVILPATDKYLGTSCTDTFTISKIDITEAEVNVENIKVGQTPAPSVTGLPEDYDGEITYAYFGGDGETYSADSLKAGSYLVRATVTGTDKYEGTTCETDLVVSKYDITDAEVTVASIKVGQTPEPSVTGLPADYDGEITYAYIDGNGEDCAADSLAAGSYLVRVTIPETDKYERKICEADLTVGKNDITGAEVTVDNIKVGQTPAPSVTGLPEDYNGEITFKYKSGVDGEYSATVPTAAGTYEVLATLAETDKYLGTSCTGTFTIGKIAVEAEVSVDDIFVGGTVDPVVTVDPEGYDGEISYQYKHTEDANYTSSVPSAAGTYEVLVILPATDKYLGTSCADTFTISKNGFEASVTVDNILVGGTVEPELSGVPEDYDGEITIEYKSSTDEEYSASVPAAAGSYEVLVTLSETDKYLGTSCADTFTIGKIDITEAEVTVDNIKVGQIPAPSVTGLPEDYDGEITYSYIDENGETCSADSLKAGTYLVMASISDTDNYVGLTCETEFEVSKNDITDAEVTVDNIKVGQIPAPSVTGLPEDYDGEITFAYIDGNGEDCSVDSLKAGSYVVTALIPATDKYSGTSCTGTFTISKYETTAEVSVENILVDESVDPVITIEPEDYDGDITIEYKKSTDQDYSATVPTAAGSYTVRVTLSETDKYLGTTCESAFTISKEKATASVVIADIYVGGTVNPVVTTVSDGKVTFEYKSSTAPDTAYAKTVPTAAGEYTVRATIEATEKYLGTTCEDTFRILKKEATATVEVANIYVGELPDPVVTTVSNGKVTFEYKSSEEEEYSGKVPTAAGEYTVRATIAETDTYLGTTCTATFKISKNAVTASVSVADIYVGETPSPVISTVSKGTVTLEYKPSKAPDTAYSETVPSAAGEYTVRATIAETDIYLGTTCTATFKISKIAVDASVSVSDILVGGTVDPVMTGIPEDYEGTVTFMYKAQTADDSAYTSTVPSEAGKYTILAKLSETDKYLSTTCTDTFTISKNETTASVSVADIYVGDEVTPVLTTVSNGKTEAVFEYKLSADSDTAFSTTVPTAAGTYTVRATVPATVEYAEIVCFAEFKIMLNPVTKMELSVPDIYYGQTVKPSFETDSDGKVTIMYKSETAPDSAYTETAPTAVGDYTAIAIVNESAVFASASVTTGFSISYLENPQIAYVPSGTPGSNGYYTSDVVLKAPEGYLISATPDGEFTDSIPFTEDLGVIYLKRIEDNALTAAIVLSDKPKIDKIAPVINDTAGGLLEDAILFEESLVVVVDDKNLTSLTVNGDAVALNANGTATLTLTRPEDGYMKYHIVAVDVAGNTSMLDITLMADWLKEKIIPSGRALPLNKGEMYYLDVGEWIVTIVNSDGTETESKTIFNGNMPFYVNADAKYIFKKVT